MSLKHSIKLKDYKGQHLCEACWNNAHYIRSGIVKRVKGKDIHTGPLVTNCAGIPCECPCRKVLNERPRRVKRDAKDQLPMFGNNVREIIHRDEG